MELVNGGPEAARVTKNFEVRKNRENRCGSDNIAARAEKLAMAEVERSTQGIEKVAPGTLGTLRALTNPERQPPLPQTPVPRCLMSQMPNRIFRLDELKFAQNVRSVARGAAPTSSAMTSEHVFHSSHVC